MARSCGAPDRGLWRGQHTAWSAGGTGEGEAVGAVGAGG